MFIYVVKTVIWPSSQAWQNDLTMRPPQTINLIFNIEPVFEKPAIWTIKQLSSLSVSLQIFKSLYYFFTLSLYDNISSCKVTFKTS